MIHKEKFSFLCGDKWLSFSLQLLKGTFLDIGSKNIFKQYKICNPMIYNMSIFVNFHFFIPEPQI